MGKSPDTPTSARAAAGRLPREDPRAEVGEDIRVGVGVGPIEIQQHAAMIAGNIPTCSMLHAIIAHETTV